MIFLPSLCSAPALCCSSAAEPESLPVQGWLWWGCSKSRQDFRLHLMNSSAGMWFIISCIAFIYTNDKFVVFCCNLPLYRAITQITRLKVWVILPLIHLWQDSKEFMQRAWYYFFWQILWVNGVSLSQSVQELLLWPTALPLATLN